MIKKIIFTLIVIFIFCLLVEGVSRIVYPFWYKKFQKVILEEESNFYMHDPVLGWTITPNFEGDRSVNNTKWHYKTNSLGIRDKEYPFQKPHSTFRILCLGDSITEGMAVNNEGAYPKFLEAKFAKEKRVRNVEVINTGVVDYGIEQEYIFLRERGIKYDPNMVVLGYFLNDGRGFVPSKTIYIKGFTDLINKSKFLYLIDKMIMKYRIKYQYKLWEKDRHEFWMSLYKKGTWRTSKEERYQLIALSKKDWGLAWTDEGWERTRMFLDQFRQLKEKYGFKFVVVAFPINVQLYSEPTDGYMFLPQEKLKEYCQAHNIPFIDIFPYFKKYKEEEILFDYCHPTAFGLELVSQVIYDAIKNEVPK